MKKAMFVFFGLTIGCSFVHLSSSWSAEVGTSRSVPFFTQNRSPELRIQRNLHGIGEELSGVTFVSETGTYFIVDDTKHELYEIKITGKKVKQLRTIETSGFHDLESVQYLYPAEGKEDTFFLAVTEEVRGNVVIFQVGPKTSRVDLGLDTQRHHVVNIKRTWKKFWNRAGLEAMTFDSESGRGATFYFGKEERPQTVYKGRFRNDDLWTTIPWDAEAIFPSGGDISDMAFYRGNLFVVSQELGVVFQVNPDTGKIISSFTLPEQKKYKYEGLSLVDGKDGSTEMVVVGEPNRILVYEFPPM